jgi:hypothetical protein
VLTRRTDGTVTRWSAATPIAGAALIGDRLWLGQAGAAVLTDRTTGEALHRITVPAGYRLHGGYVG